MKGIIIDPIINILILLNNKFPVSKMPGRVGMVIFVLL